MAAELLAEYINGEDLKIVGHYGSAEAAIEGLSENSLPDIVLMDVGLPGMSGTDATKVLKERHPALEILMLTTFEDTATIVRAIKSGASGYLLKAASSEEISSAIREVCRGGSFMTGSVARTLLAEFKQAPELADAQALEMLTERERMILDRLVQGQSYKVISVELSISVHTVNNHIRHIYRKLQVNSRAEAVAKALGVAQGD